MLPDRWPPLVSWIYENWKGLGKTWLAIVAAFLDLLALTVFTVAQGMNPPVSAGQSDRRIF